MTGEETRNDAPGSRRFLARLASGKFPIRLKLAAVLLLPMLLLVVMATVRVVDVRNDARAATAEAQMAKTVTGQGSLLDLLIDERTYSVVHLMGAEEMFRTQVPGQHLEIRSDVDAAREEFRAFVTGQGEEVEEVYSSALDALAELPEIRDLVDSDDGPYNFQNVEVVQDVFDRFEQVIRPLLAANEQVATSVTDPALQRGTVIVDQSLRQSNTMVVLVYRLLLAAIGGDADGLNTPDEYSSISMLLRDLRKGDELIQMNADGTYREVVDVVYSGEHLQAFPEVVEAAIETGAPDVAALFAGAESDGEEPGYGQLAIVAEEQLAATVDGITSDAERTQAFYTIGGLLVLALVVVVTTLVAWSITRPLRALTHEAQAMANERLPGAVKEILDAPPGDEVRVPEVAPIEVRTRDEVGDVTEALNTVQNSAVDLAVEQAALRRNIADSFVNLGRRNQGLLGRLLDFITELEHKETEPNALANLFRLDHLATRMRRNAESLLVLAGIEPPRRWTAPVRITDVIRAALGEVEEYQRVAIRGVESAIVVGSAAPDLAHLLAELIENALTFSPPDQAVEVRGRYTPVLPSMTEVGQVSQERGVYTLAIIDAGVGMSETAIIQANQRLGGEESFTVAPSKYLGHYVAGIIAARHGIEVQLRNSPQRGLTATVALPSRLLSSQQAASGSAAAVPQQPAPAAATSPAQTALTRGSGLTAGAISARPTPKLGSGDAFVSTRGRLSEVASPPQSGGDDRGGWQPPITDSYRVGNAEFQIDRGNAPSGFATAEGDSYAELIHRVQGAQMPRTKPVSVPRTSLPAPMAGETGGGDGQPGLDGQASFQEAGGQGPRPPVPAPGGDGQDDERRARHVRSFLSSFSDGLEQGRDAAAREQEEVRGSDDASDQQAENGD